MKVAIDSGPLRGGDSFRGIGMYTREYIEALKKIEKSDSKNFSLKVIDFSANDLSGFDILHYPTFHPHFLTLPFDLWLPGKNKPKIVVTIHDLIRLIYPDAYPPGLRGKMKFEVQKFLLRFVDAILTISETSKKDIVRFLPVEPDKVFNISGAGRSVYKPTHDLDTLNRISLKYSLPRKFVLYVGDVNYNKNIMVLAEACEKVKIPLVIVGKQAVSTNVNFDHTENIPFRKFLDKYQDDALVMRLGFVPDEDLKVIYSLATLYCQPALYEGFGMIVLEAFACETPVLIAKTQALVEISGDAAMTADPKSPDDFANKIVKLINLSSERIKLVRNGTARLKDFSWDKTAELALGVYKQVLDRDHSRK